jgi:hypothetical protein
MDVATSHNRNHPQLASDLSEELTDWDHETYDKLITRELTPEQEVRIVEPAEAFPRQEALLAVHWHPESVPMEWIRRRIQATFPNRRHELIIPTQHNTLMSYDEFTGVEVDCYSAEFNRKIQFLCHFANEALERADVFKAMLAHTFRYRSRQLFEFIDSVLDPAYEDRVDEAAVRTGADALLVRFVRVHTAKLKRLFEIYESRTPPDAIKNKLLTYYFSALSDLYDQHLVNHAGMFLREVKKIVKRRFSLQFFYSSQEVIEEVRSLGGGIVIPHPEQFWPILLADYDVDGYEVWNPQSREYTDFLINVVNRQNRARRRGSKSILIFMGDDCHMGEKLRPPRYQDPVKAGREIGVQPAWDDLAIRKSLIIAGTSRRSVIEEYRARLSR